MKKILPIFLFLFGAGFIMGQTTFSDDFDSYAEGDFIGTKTGWTTWSGTPGGADDAPVTSELSFSGSNSVKFESYSATGGPADVILSMPYRLTSGSLIFKSQMYVVEGTAAYFNFQGGTAPGQSWSAETYFDDNGSVRVVSSGTERLTGRFPHGEWFEIEYRIDFDKNAWETIINGQCLGVFTNEASLNSVGSLDFYPTNSNAANNTSIYYLDDVYYEVSTDGLEEIELDASISEVSLKSKSLTGLESPIAGSIRNNGTAEITSFEIGFDGAGKQFTELFENVSIASGQTYEFTTGESFTYEEGTYALSIMIAGVNGSTDQKTCNDVRVYNATGVTPAPGKRVLAEEATGTWCQWCPRGDVFIRWMEESFDDYFIPIAVHQGDPMENGHIAYIRAAVPGFTGYPNMVVDRTGWFSFPTIQTVEDYFFNDIDDEVTGTFDIGAEWDGRDLKVSTGLNVSSDSESGMSVDVILIENNVTGTTAAYNQSNAYAGGANGPMGGYENLPHPVPAADMVYGHVSRGSFTDYTNVELDRNYISGDRHLANYTMNVPDTYDDDELYLVAILLNADGTVNNAMEVSLSDAIDNGFEMTTNNENIAATNELNVFPNPAVNQTFVRLDLVEQANVQINVINSVGTVVASKDYGTMTGKFDFPVDLSNMVAGMYQIQIMVNDEFTTRSIHVVK